MNNWFFNGLWFGWGVIVAACIVASVLNHMKPTDSTDPPNGRSGVDIVTDHRTGLQYLVSPHGGITPRLSANGSQMSEDDS